jgi:chemotaxis protein MotB
MAVSDRPVLVKKIRRVFGADRHAGTWKVAYADFVTAMMAFFLLMWLINTTSPEQKRGIADYFAPASVSQSTSGSGGILAGTALGDTGAKSNGSASTIENLAPEAPPNADNSGQNSNRVGAANLDTASTQALKAALDARQNAALQSAAESLKQAMQDMPELAELSKQVLIDQTPEGLRIQLVDQEGRPMFDPGSAKPNPRAEILLRAVARIASRLPNRITISGHTSANSNGSKSPGDWELSAARADAARQIMQDAGVDPDRVYQVAWKAASDPLFPDDPTLPGNRRIAIVLLRENPVLPPNH